MTGVDIAVEGLLDEAVLRRALREVGLDVWRVFGRKGKQSLLRQLQSYNEAARIGPWVVLLDLDDEAPCPGAAIAQWLPEPAPGMRLRVAVQEIEAWLLADREACATLLGRAISLLPTNPDAEADPKQLVVNLARRSSRRAIREGLVPRVGSGRSEGATYTSDLIEFSENEWRPQVAAETSPSLARSLARLSALADELASSGD
ncbi:MAG: hypothetical protein AB7O78_17800 [Thermoleophilia bacterium]